MLSWIIASIICTEYQNKFRNRESPENDCMDLSFSTQTNYDKEDGYRHLDLRIMNKGYVSVYVRERWNVKKLGAKNWTSGENNWRLLICHDSCWRDTISDLIFKNRDNLNAISTLIDWYKRTSLTDDEIQKFRQIKYVEV